MRVAFRLKSMGAGSDKYGNCECCGNPVDKVHILTALNVRPALTGKGDRTSYGWDKFGHRQCLEVLTH